jgi:hypothetical protein
MDSRTLTYLLILAVAGAALFLLNRSANIFTPARTDTFLSPYDVRGMALVHLGKPYTLNFDQQNFCVSELNRALPINRLRAQSTIALPFEKIVIYRFDQPDIDLPLADLADGTLVFRTNDWAAGGYLTEITGGSLWKMLSQAYGP